MPLREIMTLSLPAALCARLRAYCERRGIDPQAIAERAAEWELRRALDFLERMHPPSEERLTETLERVR